MLLSITTLAFLLTPEVLPTDIAWQNHVERLLLAAIAGLCATVALLFRVFLGQYAKTVSLVLKMGEMLGENSILLAKIPGDLKKQTDSIERVLHAYERCAADCKMTRERLERIVEGILRE